MRPIRLIPALSSMLFAATVGAEEAPTVRCDHFAALVDARPLLSDLYRELEARAKQHKAIDQTPVDGGRYWLRADYSDGFRPTPYPHLGCFADLRIGLAWFCSADKTFARNRGTCAPSRRGRSVQRPTAGCVSLALVLREPIVYCAPGHSPAVKWTG